MQDTKVKTFDVLCSLFVRTYDSGVLTLADRRTMRDALLKESLDEEEQRLINRILHAVRRNWIEMHGPTTASENYLAA